MRPVHRVLAANLTLVLLAAACSDNPQLASEREGASTTTTTSSTTTLASTTTVMVTTTTAAPGPDPSDTLRISYDDLLDRNSVSYVAYTDTTSALAGSARSTIVGTWNSGGTSELHISVTVDDVALRETGLGDNFDSEVAAQEALEIIEAGVPNRFLGDDFWWLGNTTGDPWMGIPYGASDGAALEAAADAATTLDPLFTSIIEVGSAVLNTDGSTTYPLILDADAIVPAVAAGATAAALFDLGWDGLSEAHTTGEIRLSEEGRLIGAYVDQTPWWRAGWILTGVDQALGDSTISWSIAISASDTERVIRAPCDSPRVEYDLSLDSDVLLCP